MANAANDPEGAIRAGVVKGGYRKEWSNWQDQPYDPADDPWITAEGQGGEDAERGAEANKKPIVCKRLLRAKASL